MTSSTPVCLAVAEVDGSGKPSPDEMCLCVEARSIEAGGAQKLRAIEAAPSIPMSWTNCVMTKRLSR
jgi:hypothetical protein